MPLFVRIATRFIAAVFVVFLWFGPFLAAFFVENNRYSGHWEPSNILYLVAPVLFYAALLVALSIIVDYLGREWLRRTFEALFVFCLAGGFLVNMVHHVSKFRTYRSPILGAVSQIAWLGIAALAGYVWSHPHARCSRWARKACTIGSPAMLVVVFQLLTGSSYPYRMDALPATPMVESRQFTEATLSPVCDKTRSVPAVYWFIFDKWSYNRTYQNGQLLPGFKHLAEFSQDALVFHNAHTPAPKTEISIPAILYQTNLIPEYRGSQVGFLRDDKFVPRNEFQSVFSAVEGHPWHRVLVGFCLPYAAWVGDEVDVCRAYRFNAWPKSIVQAIGFHSLAMMSTCGEPTLKSVSTKLATYAPYFDYYRQLHVDLRNDIKWVLTQSPVNTFAVMHYDLPHDPFIFNGDGSLRPPGPSMYDDSEANYEAHLQYLDLTIGEFISLLKKSGRLDDAMVIITSDHGWKGDPKYNPDEYDPRHVPLIVKLPRQRTSKMGNVHQIDERFETYRLGSLIAEVAGTSPVRPGLLADRAHVVAAKP